MILVFNTVLNDENIVEELPKLVESVKKMAIISWAVWVFYAVFILVSMSQSLITGSVFRGLAFGSIFLSPLFLLIVLSRFEKNVQAEKEYLSELMDDNANVLQ